MMNKLEREIIVTLTKAERVYRVLRIVEKLEKQGLIEKPTYRLKY